MPARGDAVAEAWVLTTAEGESLLDAVANVRQPGPADLERWRRSASPERVAAAVRLTECRRRGAVKFARAGAMWLERTGLEQATAEPVARHKASRFPDGLIVDLCSGIGGDTIALAGRGGVISVDLDEGMCRRSRWNAAVYGVAGRSIAVRSAAESFSIPAGAWVHIDPDRRAGAGGRRARAVEAYAPSLDFLRRLVASTPAGAIKLSPASDFDAAFGGESFEVEVVSLRGECKEATVWYGHAVTRRRRATCLPTGLSWTDRDGDAGAFAPVGPVREWVYDPDPALIRAGLIDGFASAHSLARFVAGVDFLTAAERVDSPFLAAFEVLGVFPADLKTLKREVRSRGVGTLEVKVRGLDLKPEEVRARLDPDGERRATLLLAGGRGPGLAVLATRAGA